MKVVKVVKIVKFREIVRFEFVYQAHRARTWLSFAVLLMAAYLLTKSRIDDARASSAIANSPYDIAVTTILCNMLWMLIATAVAGSAAARDVQTRMHPLIYTTPVSKIDYLGGRFLAALALNALILLMVPMGIGLALLIPGAEPEILGPFRLTAYLSAYIGLALPTAFAATAVQFSLAALRRRAALSYVASVILLFSMFGSGAVINLLQMRTLGRLLDPIGMFVLSSTWTPIEKNTLLVAMKGAMIANRLLWISIGLGVLGFTYRRFRFAQLQTAFSLVPRGVFARRRREAKGEIASRPSIQPAAQSAVALDGRRTFGLATHARQTCAIAWISFRTIARSGAGLLLWAAVAILLVLLMHLFINFRGVPLLPRTAQIITFLTSPIAASPRFPWVLIPLLIIFYAGELIWRERDAGVSEIVDATPVPDWVFLLGKFLGLSLVLVVWMALLTAAGVLSLEETDNNIKAVKIER